MGIDVPRAWQLAQAARDELHDPKCSFIQTEHAILCDCDVLFKHHEFLDNDNLYTEDGSVYAA